MLPNTEWSITVFFIIISYIEMKFDVISAAIHNEYSKPIRAYNITIAHYVIFKVWPT